MTNVALLLDASIDVFHRIIYHLPIWDVMGFVPMLILLRSEPRYKSGINPLRHFLESSCSVFVGNCHGWTLE